MLCMKHRLFPNFRTLLVLATASLAVSCGYNERIAQLQSQCDSIAMINTQQADELNEFATYISDIALSLDSIATQEVVLLSKRDREGYFLSKRQIKENMQLLKELLERQRARIDSMADSLAAYGDRTAELQRIVLFLSEQLREKEVELARLQGVVVQQRKEIKRLESEAVELKVNIDTLKRTVELQEEIMEVQDQVIHETYLRIGNKKELKKAGILKTNFWGETALNGDVDLSQFVKVDIREFTEIEIDAKSVSILTPVPPSSYRLTKSKNSIKIEILAPAEFWSLSNYLIIQTN